MALGETAIHTSPSHHCVCLRSLLPTRLSSFPFVWSLLYVSPVFRFFHLSLLFCRDWSYWWRYLLLGLLPIDASILIHFVFRVASLFYNVSLCVYFFCIGLTRLD